MRRFILPSAMNTFGLIKWRMSFQIEDRIYASDRRIFLDQSVAFLDHLPPDGTDSSLESTRIANYKRVHEFLSRPALNRFSFDDLSVNPQGNYSGPQNLILNKLYLSFLLRRIPRDLLCFGMTGGIIEMVRIYYGEEFRGLLMPMVALPKYGPELIRLAETGCSLAQVHLGWLHEFGRESASKSLTKAIYWYRLAAENINPEAFCQLARLFFFGEGVEKDLTKSMVLIEKAVLMDHKPSIRLRRLMIDKMGAEQYWRTSAQLFAHLDRPQPAEAESISENDDEVNQAKSVS